MIKFSHSIRFRITHPVTECCCLIVIFCIHYCFSKVCSKNTAIEDIVTTRQTITIITNEHLTYNKRLSQTTRRKLLGIFKVNAIIVRAMILF